MFRKEIFSGANGRGIPFYHAHQLGVEYRSNSIGDGPEKTRDGKWWFPRFKSKVLGQFRSQNYYHRCTCALKTNEKCSDENAADPLTPRKGRHQGRHCVCGKDQWKLARQEEVNELELRQNRKRLLSHKSSSMQRKKAKIPSGNSDLVTYGTQADEMYKAYWPFDPHAETSVIHMGSTKVDFALKVLSKANDSQAVPLKPVKLEPPGYRPLQLSRYYPNEPFMVHTSINYPRDRLLGSFSSEGHSSVIRGSATSSGTPVTTPSINLQSSHTGEPIGMYLPAYQIEPSASGMGSYQELMLGNLEPIPFNFGERPGFDTIDVEAFAQGSPSETMLLS